MRIQVSGVDASYFFRQLEPGDEAVIWRCCAHRPARPTYAACVELVSEQLGADAGDDYLGVPRHDAVRRLLAVWGREPVALLTVTAPADATDTPTVAVDPSGEDLAGNVAWDAAVWLAQAGYRTADVIIYWPGDRAEAFSLSELPARWGPSRRVVTFAGR